MDRSNGTAFALPESRRWPMPHHPSYKTRALHEYDTEFRERAEDLFSRVKDRAGDPRAVKRTGSYSFRVHLQGAATPWTLAKIIIRQDFPRAAYLDGSGVYVLLRANGWLDGWLEHEPWNRASPYLTVRITQALFYYFRVSDRDNLDQIADAIAAVILESPPEK